jgi:RNA polymerase sigma-70 factor, ECF subfamily
MPVFSSGGSGGPEEETVSALDDLSDPQLLVAVGRARTEALAEIFRRHAGAVLGLARRVTGDPEEAEDVLQEVFVRLWRDPTRFDPTRGSLRTFLLTECHGRAVDTVRSRAARRRREVEDARRTATADYDLDRRVWDLTLADQVARAMGALSEGERRAIELAYFDGHTYREVAELLAEPEGTVKSRIRNGLTRMRRLLAEHEVFER